MNFSTTRRTLIAALFALASSPAYAHVGVAFPASFTDGFIHPLSGLDHTAVMVSVGLWAAQKGGRATWAWPLAFVSVMLLGMGMVQIPLPFVELGILASVVALGLLVALAIDLPVSLGTAVIGVFGLFYGHAHEVPESSSGFQYLAGFAVASALLHATGIVAALCLGLRFRGFVRGAGAVFAALGASLVAFWLNKRPQKNLRSYRDQEPTAGTWSDR